MPENRLDIQALKQGIERISAELRKTTNGMNKFTLERRLNKYRERLNELKSNPPGES